MKKALMAGFLAFTMVLSAGTVLADTENSMEKPDQLDYASPLHYELEAAGTLEDPDDNFTFMYDALFDRSKEEPALLSSSGEVILEGLDDLDYIGGGLYTARTPLEENNVNKTGLYTTDGEVLIPGDAASIVTPYNREDGIRFLGVIFTTEETDNEDDCIIYFTSDMFSMNVGEDDVMYKGCLKVYDVVKKQYVPDVELASADRYGLHDLGDSFLIEHEGMVTQYDPDGKVLYESEEMLGGSAYNSYSIREDDSYKIIDSSGSDAYVHEGFQSISVVSEPLDYYCIYDNDDSDLPSHLIDMNGNRIIEDPQRIFYNAAGNVFVTEDADADKITMDYDGNVVDDATSSCYFWYAGYGTISRDDTEDIKVVTPDSILEGLSAYSEGELLFTKDDKIADLRTGDVLGAGYTADDVGETFCPGLVSIYDPSSDRYSDPKVSLYDVLSGEELLPNEYQEIESAGDYIYARPIGADTWEVYKINVVSDAV